MTTLLPGDTATGGEPVVQPLPVFPTSPELPNVPFADRRFRVGNLEIRPFAGPDIPIPKTEDEDFLRRFAAAHAALNFSLPEYIVYEFLVFKKKQISGLDFQYQNPVLGGRTAFGGFVVDFFFPLRLAAWNVQGNFYHLLKTEDRARDFIVEQILESRGIQFILLYEDDLIQRADYVLELAWNGQEVVERRVGAF